MVGGDNSKYNQAVLSDSKKTQIDQSKSSVNENDDEIKLNKAIKEAAVSGSQYSPKAIISAKKQLNQQKSQVTSSQQPSDFNRLKNQYKDNFIKQGNEYIVTQSINGNTYPYKKFIFDGEDLLIQTTIQRDSKGKSISKERRRFDTGETKKKKYESSKPTPQTNSDYVKFNASLSGIGTNKQTEIIKTTKGGTTTTSTITRIKEAPTKQINSTKTLKVKKIPIGAKKEEITPDSFITTGGNQIRSFGQDLQQFTIDDNPDSFGYSAKKKVQSGVRVIGAGVETVGEFINLVDTPVKFSREAINAAEKRGSDGEYGFADTILTFNDAYQATSKDMQKNSPTIVKVVDKDLDYIGDKLSQAGQKIKATNIINDEFQQKGYNLKQSTIEKTQLVSKTGVDLTYSGFEQTQQPGTINKLVGTAKQDAGIALTLLGEAGSGILQPVKYAKITEKSLANAKVEGVVDIARDFAEVGAGGSAYAGEIISDPKTYIAGEFEEAALLAKKPTKRGGEIIESVVTNPKGFLKASFGETVFVTGGYAGIKAVATDIEVGTKVATNEIQNIAIDNKPKTPKDNFEETFYDNNPNSQVEYVSLDSVDVNPIKSQSKPRGVQVSGDYAYKTNVVEFDLPSLPNFQKPEINIGRNTRITKSEIGMSVDYASEININNKIGNELGINNENKAEIKFDEKYDQKSEIKFDDKYDFRNDQKTDTKTKTDFRTDSKFDYKFDYRYDQRIDEKVDRRTDSKLDWAKLGQGKSKKAKGFSFKALEDDGKYVSSLGGALTGKTSKNPTKDITGLKFRAILLSNGRKK